MKIVDKSNYSYHYYSLNWRPKCSTSAWIQNSLGNRELQKLPYRGRNRKLTLRMWRLIHDTSVLWIGQVDWIKWNQVLRSFSVSSIIYLTPWLIVECWVFAFDFCTHKNIHLLLPMTIYNLYAVCISHVYFYHLS